MAYNKICPILRKLQLNPHGLLSKNEVKKKTIYKRKRYSKNFMLQEYIIH